MSAARVCALIPTFDNPATLAGVVEAVSAHLDQVIVVDDGSGPAGRAACDDLAAAGLIDLVRLPANQGKGGAVMAGLRRAAERGFSHAFQLDADGQHDTDAMPRFLAAHAARPEAVVLGFPEYDASAPRGRLVARRLTTFWVNLEVGGADRVTDAMIGFRVYPVAATLACGTRTRRMDFDIEVAVRLVRAGVPVVNLPVAVRYLDEGEGGVSHFQPLRDNLRFAALHSRLCTAGALGWLRRRLTGARA